MGLRVNTNVNSIMARRALMGTGQNVSNNLRKLSSGERITRAADDAAGLAISENLKSQIRATRQAARNSNDAVSLIQTSEGALMEVSNILIRMRELAMQTSSDTMGNTERKFTDVEFQNLKDEIERIAQASEFNGIKLLDGTGGLLEFQVGTRNNPLVDRLMYDTTNYDSTVGTLGVHELGVSTKGGSQMSLKTLDDALVKVSGMRAGLGAMQNRLNSVTSNLNITDENLSAANSRIRDVDVAQETADLTRNNILMQAGVSVLSQANKEPQSALQLLN